MTPSTLFRAVSTMTKHCTLAYRLGENNHCNENCYRVCALKDFDRCLYWRATPLRVSLFYSKSVDPCESLHNGKSAQDRLRTHFLLTSRASNAHHSTIPALSKRVIVLIPPVWLLQYLTTFHLVKKIPCSFHEDALMISSEPPRVLFNAYEVQSGE